LGTLIQCACQGFDKRSLDWECKIENEKMKMQVDIFFSQHPGDIVIVFKSKCIEKFYVAGFIISKYELFFVK